MRIVIFALLNFSLGMIAAGAINLYFARTDPLTKIRKRLDHMANELQSLQAAAAAAIALLQKLAAALSAAGAAVPAADVQAVTDQLNAAVTANTPPTP